MRIRKAFLLGLTLLICSEINPKGSEPRSLVSPTLKHAVPRKHDSFDAVSSWYGDDFQGEETANGEIFDQFGLTAAHRYLPFGTPLQVTNPQNGKSVVVRVNDRGPYIYGRDIDLSWRAAFLLGMSREGVARLRVKILRNLM